MSEPSPFKGADFRPGPPRKAKKRKLIELPSAAEHKRLRRKGKLSRPNYYGVPVSEDHKKNRS